MMALAFKTGLSIVTLMALVGCDVDPAQSDRGSTQSATPQSSSLNAALSPGTSVEQIDEAEILTGKYKDYKRSFMLVYTENGKRTLAIAGAEKRTEPRKTQAQLITMTRDICRQQGKPSGAVSVSNVVSDRQIITFLKCD